MRTEAWELVKNKQKINEREIYYVTIWIILLNNLKLGTLWKDLTL
jgi:hypothetical protein